MSDDAKAVREAQERVWAAANGRDLEALRELLDDGFLLVEADTLERKGKAEFLADVAERGSEEGLLAFELTNVRVQAAGDMAVAYAQFHGEEEVDGDRLRMSGNSVDVFVRRDGRWRLAGSVYGEVPPFAE